MVLKLHQNHWLHYYAIKYNKLNFLDPSTNSRAKINWKIHGRFACIYWKKNL